MFFYHSPSGRRAHPSHLRRGCVFRAFIVLLVHRLRIQDGGAQIVVDPSSRHARDPIPVPGTPHEELGRGPAELLGKRDELGE